MWCETSPSCKLDTGLRQNKTLFTPHFKTGQNSFTMSCRRQSILFTLRHRQDKTCHITSATNLCTGSNVFTLLLGHQSTQVCWFPFTRIIQSRAVCYHGNTSSSSAAFISGITHTDRRDEGWTWDIEARDGDWDKTDKLVWRRDIQDETLLLLKMWQRRQITHCTDCSSTTRLIFHVH